MLDFKKELDNETLKPMMIRSTVPMCMFQYERMFSTTRIPGRVCEAPRRHPRRCCPPLSPVHLLSRRRLGLLLAPGFLPLGLT